MLDSCTGIRASADDSPPTDSPDRGAGQLRRPDRVNGRLRAAGIWRSVIQSSAALVRIADKKERGEMRRGHRAIQVGDMFALGRQGSAFLRAIVDEIEADTPTPGDSPLAQMGRAMSEFGDVARVVTDAMANPSSPGRFDELEARQALREIAEARAVLDGLERTIRKKGSK